MGHQRYTDRKVSSTFLTVISLEEAELSKVTGSMIIYDLVHILRSARNRDATALLQLLNPLGGQKPKSMSSR